MVEKLFKKTVDERQELELMKVERSTFYFIVYTLCAFVFIQQFVNPHDMRLIAGECVVLLATLVFYVVNCIRRGVWDYKNNLNMKSYIRQSLLTFICGLVLAPLMLHFGFHAPFRYYLIAGVGTGISVGVVTFLLSFTIGSIIKRRQKELQDKYDDE